MCKIPGQKFYDEKTKTLSGYYATCVLDYCDTGKIELATTS